jgi:hypothetical protein
LSEIISYESRQEMLIFVTNATSDLLSRFLLLGFLISRRN